MKNPRKIKNFLLMPRIQLRYMYYILAINIAPMAALISYTALQFQKLHLEMEAIESYPPAVSGAIDNLISHLSMAFVGCFVLVSLLVIYGAIVVSHRFVGPMFVINRYIKAMQAGDFQMQRELRKDDEMQETFELLKQLGQQLAEQDKKGS
jgi:nitrogen fixation/metabolism regulation signal transduction histidine kinase